MPLRQGRTIRLRLREKAGADPHLTGRDRGGALGQFRDRRLQDLHQHRPRPAGCRAGGAHQERTGERDPLRPRRRGGCRATGHRAHPRDGAEQGVQQHAERHERADGCQLQHRPGVRKFGRFPDRVDLQDLHPHRLAAERPWTQRHRQRQRAHLPAVQLQGLGVRRPIRGHVYAQERLAR